MTDQQELLTDELNELLDKADNIEHQLEMAEARHLKERFTIDSIWQAKAKYALKATRRDISRLQQELSTLNKAYATRRQMTFERQFINLSRKHLDRSTFDVIVQEVNDIVERIEHSGAHNLNTQNP